MKRRWNQLTLVIIEVEDNVIPPGGEDWRGMVFAGEDHEFYLGDRM
jgi:hypothetical protein